jgi:O-succinylbenzoate synthase
MKIERIELRQIFLPYKAPFETSGWVEDGNYAVIAKVYSEGLIGWGESPAGKEPWYNEETTDTAWSIQKDFLVPLLLSKEIQRPEEAALLFNPVRGNKIAKTALEFAVWDLAAKTAGKSISDFLGGDRKRVPVGVSIGIQKNISSLLGLVEEYLKEGYQRIKIKIKPGNDIRPVQAIRQSFPGILFQVDANSIYTLDDAEHLKELDEYNLLLIEQPLANDDIFEHSKLQKKLKTPLCLDESITSPAQAAFALEIDACRVINIKPSRVGGLTEARKIHDLCMAKSVPVWCGGMLETGIGRTFNAALASLPGFTLPGDISANDRYFERDIVLNPFKLNYDGTLDVPELPGCGAIVDEDFLETITLRKYSTSEKGIYQ